MLYTPNNGQGEPSQLLAYRIAPPLLAQAACRVSSHSGNPDLPGIG